MSIHTEASIDALVDAMQSSDWQSVRRIMKDRDRAFDNYFRDGAWEPVLRQNLVVIPSITLFANYFRVGRLVIAECLVEANGAGTSSKAVDVSLPPELPVKIFSTSNTYPMGEFYMHQISALGGHNTGMATVSHANDPTRISGYASGTTNVMGISSPSYALSLSDNVGFMVAYLADNVAVL